MRKSRLRLFAPLVMVFALIGAACANDNSSSNGGTSGSGGATGSSGAPQTLLDRIMADGVIRVATDPAYPPQSSYDEATNTWEGFDIDVANEIAKRLGLTKRRLADAVLGHHHRRQLERPVGHVGRVDDGDRGARQGARLHRPVLLHAGRSRGAAGKLHHVDRPTGRQEDRRLRRLHLRVVPEPRPQHPRLHPHVRRSRRTSRSRPTTRTRPRSRTWRSAGSTR